MNKIWSVEEAARHFAALVKAAQADGPQIVTRNGVEEAVVLSHEAFIALMAHAPKALQAAAEVDPMLAPQRMTTIARAGEPAWKLDGIPGSR
jgi:prevent-host-death family protein